MTGPVLHPVHQVCGHASRARVIHDDITLAPAVIRWCPICRVGLNDDECDPPQPMTLEEVFSAHDEDDDLDT